MKMLSWLKPRWLVGLAMVAVVSAIAACGTDVPVDSSNYPKHGPREGQYARGSVLGDGGITLFGSGKSKAEGEGGAGIGVNSFLWRASLDTIAFMPLAQADPFGGVIITDWHSPPETPNERFKVTVYILDRQLRADGVRASVFRQQKDGGDWRDTPLDPAVGIQLEDTILTRARQMRMASSSGS